MTTIVTWNVNSIRARLPNIIAWLEEHKPDIVLLQELKCEKDQFPFEAFDAFGYNIEVYAQKSLNGVAVLSKYPIEDAQYGLPTFSDTQARYLEVFTRNMRVASVYVPNGEDLASEKFPYKLEFMDRFYEHLQKLYQQDECTIIGGDLNVAYKDEDTYDPHVWHDRICVSDPERQRLHGVFNIGFIDAHRLTTPHGPGPFTWWGYRGKGYELNYGLRLDYMLLSPSAAYLHDKTFVDILARDKEKASDHAPLVCHLKDNINDIKF